MKYIENLQSHCSGDSFLYLQFACTVSDHIENLQSHCSGDSFLYLQFACTVSDHGK